MKLDLCLYFHIFNGKKRKKSWELIILLIFAVLGNCLCLQTSPENLDETTTLLPESKVVCAESEFHCILDNKCIPKSFMCDLSIDCSNGEDENLSECDFSKIHPQRKCDTAEYFHCTYSRKCIPREWTCDEIFDCGFYGKDNMLDESDENLNCSLKCEKGELPCSDNVCLPISKFCNKVHECANDEKNCDDRMPCKKLNCNYDCSITFSGPKCYCPKNQQVVNQTECEDFNECTSRNEVCDQLCENLPNTFKCKCIEGYEWLNKKCYANNNQSATNSLFIVLLSAKELVKLVLPRDQNIDIETNKGVGIQLLQLRSPISMDINYQNETACVLENSEITCYNSSNFQNKWVLPVPDLFPNLDTISQIALDWISGNWYYMDSMSNMMFMCTSEMRHCRIIIPTDPGFTSKFRHFVIDPNAGYLFLTKYNLTPNTSAIVRLSMDGSKVTNIITNKILYPNAITLDLGMQRIYFLDDFFDFIQQCDYDGKNRKFLQKMANVKLHIATFFENIFYGVSPNSFSLIQLDKADPNGKKVLLDHLDYNTKTIKIFHPQIQLVKTKICAKGQCDHLCIPVLDETSQKLKAKCFCGEGFEMNENGKCEQNVPEKFMVFVKNNPKMIKAINLNEKSVREVMMPITNIQTLVSFDVDAENKMIYFSRQNGPKFSIEVQSFNGSYRKAILTNLTSINGLAWDSFGKNLFYITTTSINAIKISADHKNNLMMKTLLNRDIDKPMSMTLNVAEGWIYWSSWAHDFKQGGKIEAAWMDGTNRKVIAQKDHEGNVSSAVIYWPVSLTYDTKANKLYWWDVVVHTLECLSFENNSRETIFQAVKDFFPYAVSIMDNLLYFSDHQRGLIEQVSINSSDYIRDKTLLFEETGVVTQLKPVSFKFEIDNIKDKEFYSKCPGLVLRTPSKNSNCMCGNDLSKNALGNECKPSITNKKLDEKPLTVCIDGEFRCQNAEKCIKNILLCDGVFDCRDKSDELAAPDGPCQKPPCDFKCDGSRCLVASQVCNSQYECVDGTDEAVDNCPQNKTIQYCEFICSNGNCVELELICNEENDCGDNSDELNCKYDGTTNGPTLSSTRHDEIDAEDFDDDEDFPTEEFNTEENCKHPNYLCLVDKRCIPVHKLCNGIFDCSDFSDEDGRCNEKLCNHVTQCSHFCHNSPHVDGYVCSCPSHMFLDSDQLTCGSARTCDNFASCSHSCKQIDSNSISCHCFNNYRLASDNFTCESIISDDAIILFSNKHVIRGLNLKTKALQNYYSLSKNLIALDFFYNREEKTYEIFWSDVFEDKIFNGIVKDGELLNIKTVVNSGLSTTESIGLDWIGNNIYWIDSVLRQIEVAKKSGLYRKTLISDTLYNPRSIALDPRIGYLFWSDWGEENPCIERATMSGDERKIIFFIKKIHGAWPNGLTLDYVKKRIFFLDALSKDIHTINYEGMDHKKILKNPEYLSHPFAISVFENHVFWTDWRLNGVLRADKFTGNNVSILYNASTQPFDLKIMHPSRQPWDFNGDGTTKEKENPCGIKNGGCSHLCLLSTLNTFKCDCPHFFRLTNNKKECESIENLLIYISGAAEIKGVDLKHPYSLAISTIKHATEILNPTHLDFNPKENRLYWSDTQLNELKTMQLSTTLLPSSQKLETIIDTAFDKLNGFAIDYVSELIFFTQMIPTEKGVDDNVFKSNRLMATNLRGEFMTKILDDLNEIYSMIVSPEHKVIYFSMLLETDKNFTINQCQMDGSDMTSIITEDEIIHSLSLDIEKNRLYFVKNYRKIFYFDFNTKRTTLVNIFYGKYDQDTKYNNIFINSLVVHQDLIYFGENYTNSILTCNRDVCQKPEIYRNNTVGLKQLKILTLTPSEKPLLSNGCSISSINSKPKCQHLCLPIANGHECSCALGYTKNLNDPSKCSGNDDFLIYNMGYQLRGLSLTLKFPGDLLIPLQKIHEISSFDFDAKSDYFFLADNDNSEILKIKKDGSQRQVLLNSSENLDHSYGDWLGGLAVDWIADNLYWTDHLRGLIEVSRLNGAFRYVISSQLNKPNMIALDPVVGVLFFLDGDYKIIRQYMDGGFDKFYVNKFGESNIINHFVLDTSNQKIFWCESKTNKIWQVDYDGNEMKQLDIEVLSPTSLAFTNGKLYWLERASIKMIKNMTNLNETVVWWTNLTSPVKNINIYSSRKQRGNNLCSMPYYGGCEELCLFNGNNATCHCSNGYVDAKNGKSCQNYKNFLFYSRIDTIEKMLVVSKDDNSSNNFNISNKNFLKNAIALTYDYENKLIYYSDLQLHGIFSCDFYGKNFRQIVYNQMTVEGITFNPLNNRIFWTLNTDAQIRSIDLNLFKNKSVTEDSGQIPPDIIMKFKKGDDKLRAITLEPCLNMLYWTNWGKTPSIQRAYVTGSGREDIIWKDITMPNAITLDYVDKRIFWADARLDKIERCDYDGRNRVILAHSSPKHPFSISIFGDHIFWSDWILHGVLRANKYSGNDVTFLRRNIQKPMGIIVVQETVQNCSSTRCGGVLNGGCEDVCLPHGIDEVKCECTQGTLDKSGKRCLKRQKESSCDETKEFECGSGDCVPYELTCDKAANCLDESDEDIKYCATRKCPIENFFQCQDFKCISKNLVCNGINNCQMGEDEENCKCKETEFKCGSGECISRKFVCDYDKDCSDVSDEINCERRDCNLGSIINTTNLKHTENSNFVQCEHTTACILPAWICDGFDDCWDNSDEKNCEEKKKNSTCPIDKFQCPNGNCIPLEWVCDFESDCEFIPSPSTNGSENADNTTSFVKPKILPIFSADEQNCQPHCQKNQFKCPNSSTCVPLSWLCDSIADCPGGEDEESCAFTKCEEWEFKCNITLKCISKKWRCDGQVDCDLKNDDSDEKDCHVICGPDQFRCNSYTCIDNYEVCDGNINCPGSEDEGDHCDTESYTSSKNHECNEDEFQCQDSECITKSLVCNSRRDCIDGSDELKAMCQNFTYDVTRCAEDPEKFHCSNGVCIDNDKTCNLLDDCGDFSDEQSCNINECEYVECQHECVDLKIGYKCTCHDGFAVEEDNPNLCKDIDECLSKPCSQICINTHGSYKCECYDMFVKKNKTLCKADTIEKSKIVFSNRYYIRAVDFQGKVEILAHNLSNAVALDFDWNQKYLYYSDVTTTHSEISRIKLQGNSTLQKEVLHQQNMKNPDGLAFDWIAKNLYWCDKGRRTIEVSQDTGRFRKILIQKNLDEPRAIVLDPYKKFFYWSDWGTMPHIGKAGMDGSQPHSIIEGHELGWPNALTISFETNELFYGDAREDYIAVCDLDGKNRKIIMSRHLNPGLNLHHIFSIAVWEDKVMWSDWELKTIEYCDKYTGQNCGTLVKNEHRPMDLRVFHPLRQQKLTSHLAINIKRPFNNTKSGTFRKKIENLNLEQNPCAGAKCDALCLLSPVAPYYKCECPDNFVLERKETISKSPTGKPIQSLTDHKNPQFCRANCTADQILCPKSMKCIPFFHECDSVADCLIVGGTEAEDEPDDCRKFHCQPGQFQCDDGKTLANVKCLNPDLICDGKKNCDDGKDEDNCNNYGCFIHSQFRCEQTDNTTAYCISGNKRCDKEIDCPNGNDEKDCPLKVCTNTQFRCNSTDTCVPKVWLCDGESDCISGEDERNCNGRLCADNEFRCNNGRCLPKAWICDNEPDCLGGEDEVQCSSTNSSSLTPCDPSYFRCNDSNCVPGRYQCDGSDGSDEINCMPRNCSESEFRCHDGQCIAGTHKCDKETQCKDLSDEVGCHISCDKNSFKCEKQNLCINKALLCNGQRDCLDYSDEKNCDCKRHEYKCKGSLENCILKEFECDGIMDCQTILINRTEKNFNTSDDEDHCSNRSCSGNAVKCGNGKCISKSTLCTENADNCADLKKLYCDFKKPYENVKVGCKFGRCSQICVENQKSINSFQCKCSSGFHKSGMVKNATCRATHGRYLIFTASDSELRFIFGNSPESLEMSTQRSRISSKFLGDTLPKVHSFINTDSIKICSFDYIIDEDNNIVLYWLDQVASNILKRVNIKTSQDFENIKDHGFNASSTISVFIHKLANDSTIKTLAVDWINSKVYLLENDMIRVVNDGKEEKSIIDAGPHSADLVVDPETRQMFWSTMLRLIYVASMDGNGKRKLVHENIEYASGLAIDYPAKRLYWCDFRKSTIETVNFDGHDRQLVRKFENLDEFGLKISPFKMDIFEDEMFVVFSNRSILKLNKFGYQHHDEIFENGPYQNEASHIKIVHAFKRKYSNNNPCVKNPCDKSAICLLSSTEPLKRSCLCADSMYMQKNGSYVKCLNFSDVPKMCTRKCNEGKCRYNSNNEQFCECPPKFEGPFCDQYICSGFCLNQGICQIPSEKVHSAVTSKELKEQRICRCTKNYTGDRCQIPSHMCKVCHNGGTCFFSLLPNNTIVEHCVCALNFSGSKCENCASLQCLNQGVCRQTPGDKFVCDCKDMYAGTHCEIDRCENFCKNNGKCHFIPVTGTQCSCVNGFKGINCEIDDKCENFCLNGGICERDDFDAVKCQCPPFYSGNKCQEYTCHDHKNCHNITVPSTDLQNCNDLLHCENNGICRLIEDSEPYCECAGDWMGANCSLPPECLNNECGKCNEQSSINECVCNGNMIQPCLIGPDTHFDGSVIQTELPTGNHEKASIILVLTFLLVLLFTLVVVSVFYIRKWQRRNRFFAHARLNENVEEITNPIFDYSAAIEAEDTQPVATTKFDGNNDKGHFSNPIYESMYASATHTTGLLEKKHQIYEEEEEIKN